MSQIPVTTYQVGLLIKKIAWKIGADDYGLTSSDFEFVLDTSLEDNSYRIASGRKVIIRHRIIPINGFEAVLRRIISQVPSLVRSTALQLASDIIASDAEFRELSPEPELDDSEFHVEEYMVVRVRHKSGFVVTKASIVGVGGFGKLRRLAKKETADLLRALGDSDSA